MIRAPVTQMRNTSSTTYSRGTWVASSAATSDWSTRKRTRSASRETSGPCAAACIERHQPLAAALQHRLLGRTVRDDGLAGGAGSAATASRRWSAGSRDGRRGTRPPTRGRRRGRAAASATAAAGAGAEGGTAGGGVPSGRERIDAESLLSILRPREEERVLVARIIPNRGSLVTVSLPPRPTPPRRRDDFHDLMRHRVMDILLVSSPYDSFVLEEAGELSERVLGEFRNLDLHYGPGITSVATGAEALALAGEQSRFNLIVTTLQLGDMNAAELARRAARRRASASRWSALAFDNSELTDFLGRHDVSGGGPRVPLAGRRAHPGRHRQGRGGPAERRPRHRRRRRAGHPGHRGQRPLLLVAPARHLRRAAAPVAAAHFGGREPGAEDPAHAGAARRSSSAAPSRRRGRRSPPTATTSWA